MFTRSKFFCKAFFNGCRYENEHCVRESFQKSDVLKTYCKTGCRFSSWSLVKDCPLASSRKSQATFQKTHTYVHRSVESAKVLGKASVIIELKLLSIPVFVRYGHVQHESRECRGELYRRYYSYWIL